MNQALVVSTKHLLKSGLPALPDALHDFGIG